MRLVAGLLIGDALGHEAAAIESQEQGTGTKRPLMFEELGGGWRFSEGGSEDSRRWPRRHLVSTLILTLGIEKPGARGRFVEGGGSNVCSTQTEQILLMGRKNCSR